MSTTKRWCTGLLGAMVLLGAHLPAARAEDPPRSSASQRAQAPRKAPPATLKMVEITGTLIRAPNLTSESPITVVNAAQIQDQGVTNIEDVLNELPQFHAGQNMTTANHSTGVANLNLRGLGPTRTLVLIDGRRLGPGDVQDANGAAADVNFIPAALVSSVDVLTGGASAVYGSDAIAGVVNFHLIDDFQGVQVTETGTADQHTQSGTLDPVLRSAPYLNPVPIPGDQFGGFISDTTVLVGTNTPDDRGNVTMYLDYRHTSQVLNGTRDFQGCSVTLNSPQTGLVCGGSSNSLYGNFQTNSGQTLALNPNGTATFVPFTHNLKYSNSQVLGLQRDDTRTSLGAIGHQQINPWVDIYAQAMLMQDKTVAYTAPGGLSSGGGPTGFIQVPCNNQFLSDAEEPYICQDAAGNPLPRYQANGQPNVATILMPALRIGGYPGLDNFKHTDYWAALGARGKINAAWSYDISGTYWDTLLSESFQNDVGFDKVQNAINGCTGPANSGCVPLNIFQYGGITAAQFNYIAIPELWTGDSQESTIDAHLSGNLGPYGGRSPWAKDPVAVALGVSYRTDALSYLPDNVLQTNQGLGQGSFFPPISGSESVKDAYLEARMPLVEGKPLARAIDLDVAARHSAYNIGGSAPGVSTNTFKVAADYAPTADLRFRSSFNRAERAPNLYELFLPRTEKADTGYADPCAGTTPTASLAACENTGVTPGEYGKIPQCPAINCSALVGGNPALRPEVGDTVTFGLTLTPRVLRGFDASIDYWDIKIKNYVTNLSGAAIVNGCLLQGNNALCYLVHRGSIGQLFGTNGYSIQTNTNFGELHDRGVDLNLNYLRRLPEGWGSIGFRMTGTYLVEQSISTVVSYNCAGLYGPICSSGGEPGPSFRWRHNARVTWLTPWNLDLSLNWRYLSSTRLDLNSSQPALYGGSYDAYDAVIPAYNYFDVSLAWMPLEKFTVRFGVNNILDKDPPISSDLAIYNNNGGANGNVYSGTYDSLGRVMFVTVNVRF